MTSKRNRRIGSIKIELLNKSKEAALTAVQIFNNPNILFKAESYIVLMIIAWTYLLHAHYRKEKTEYRYYELKGKRRKFNKTKNGAFKYWELERCLNCNDSPIDKHTANNLRFLIGLRHEIEHQMTSRIDDLLSARFQACCLNYNHYYKKFFPDRDGIEKHLSFSLQLSTISLEQKDLLSDHPELPEHIVSYIHNFEENMSEDEFNNPQFAYRILFVRKTANRKGQADRVIEFVKSDSEITDLTNKRYALIKETDREKFLPGQIVSLMVKEGYPNFNMHHHTELWQNMNAKEPDK